MSAPHFLKGGNMKLYQKFVWSFILVAIFSVYAFMRHYDDTLKDEHIHRLEASLEYNISENKYLQGEIERLKLEIVNLGKQNELETIYVIRDYIQNRNRHAPKSVAEEIAKNVVTVSNEKEVALPLILGIMEVESEFNPFAKSKAGARGLMQVMPESVGKLPTKVEDKYDLHDIQTGIRAGVDVFKIHLDENDGNVTKGLYHYVNKDNTYATKVYQAIGRFLAFAK